jgi:predicted P-loop ATPase
MSPCGLTILRTLGPLATKKFSIDPVTAAVVKTPFGNARYFSAQTVEITSIYDLSAKLFKLESDRRASVVRGALAEGVDPARMRRLLYADGDDQPTLVRCPRRWVMIDFDRVVAPDGIDPAADPESAITFLVSLLPSEFTDVTCHWQFGSSQGFRPGLLSAHLWFWLDREVDDRDLERWAKENRATGVDPAVFRPVQIHYTAAPTFEGVPDPLPRRSGFRKGSRDEVAIVIPAESQRLSRGAGRGLKPAVGFEGYVARIGTEDGFQGPIMSAIAAYVRAHGAGGTDTEALAAVLRSALLEADPGGRDEAEIARYASDAYLRDKIEWTIAKEKASLPRTEVWHSDLICSVDQFGNRKVKNVVANAILILQNDAAWTGVIAFDEFAQRLVVRGRPPYAEEPFVTREWRDEDDILTAAWLQRAYGLLGNAEIARQAALTVGRDHPFHPVREYLDGLTWDGVPRLDSMLKDYFGAETSAYTAAVGSCWLISAVARIYDPGCKADHVLILEGRQGSGKSTGLRMLGGGWFTDEIDAIGSKDAATQLQGVWIVELPELDAMSRSEVSRIKAFMSKSFDRFRPPYGKHAVRFERQCVFAGTVNHSDYLRDETGNRRFWPVRCSSGGQNIDIGGLKRDRDQLWAEAVVRFRRGDRWWLETPGLVAAAAAEQDARYATDAWEASIAGFVRVKDWTTVAEVLTFLSVETPKQGQTEQNRVARCLKRLGWRRGQRTLDGVRVWGYVPSAPVEAAAPVGGAASGAEKRIDSLGESPLSPVSPLAPHNEKNEGVGGTEGPVVGGGISRKLDPTRCTSASGAVPRPEHVCLACGDETTPSDLFCPPCWAARVSRRQTTKVEVPS